MKIKASNAIASTLLCVLAATFVTGCEKKNANGVAAPGGDTALRSARRRGNMEAASDCSGIVV